MERKLFSCIYTKKGPGRKGYVRERKSSGGVVALPVRGGERLSQNWGKKYPDLLSCRDGKQEKSWFAFKSREKKDDGRKENSKPAEGETACGNCHNQERPDERSKGVTSKLKGIALPSLRGEKEGAFSQLIQGAQVV